MTRFARARGSKASNERVPEPATPWSVMKQQFLSDRRVNFSVEERSTSTIHSDRASGSNEWTSKASMPWTETNRQYLNDRSANSSLEGKHESIHNQSSKNVSTVWEDFGGVKRKNSRNSNNLKKVSKSCKDLKKLKNKKGTTTFSVEDSTVKAVTSFLQSAPALTNSEKSDVGKKKRKKKGTETKFEESELSKLGPFVKNHHVSETDVLEKGKTNYDVNKLSVPVNSFNSNSNGYDASNSFEKGSPDYFQKNKFSGNGRRYNFDDYPDTMIIGGNIVEIGEFQGFPVKKEDEVRLKSLRKDLQAKGISRKEIEYVLKGERRRAEKALAREKKLACFNCRRFGHNVAECPELGDQTEVGKVCFKCGSTEHKYTDCKVVPEKDAFRFAECFICKEQGHISRQCPDNPRGLYPKGGGCKVCGSVTHLKKDCPDLVTGKEKSAITVGTVDESSILEALDEEVTNTYSEKTPSKKKRKIVKF
ncbi:hypothetical protein LSTR_LSTR006357 [Laodelphax striatellus]|uniref:CCHC-type domain-containing protein n=1 Tax=Laodelphax striatellus TaxID=195883 RepID=A0A482XDE6_LAOST|nr:hypothetical protein LSTR_LSTR006357 [Laodelphax striatellus]